MSFPNSRNNTVLPTTLQDRKRLAIYLELRKRAKQEKSSISNPFEKRKASEWIETFFTIPETNAPIALAPYQRVALDYFFSTETESDRWQFGTMLWSDIKKSAKSSIAAAIALWTAFTNPYGQVIIVANDLRQANSRVFYYLTRSMVLNPVLRQFGTIRNYRVTLSNRASIEAVAIDPGGEAGSNADAIIFSELWAANSKAHSAMWSELTLSPTKFGRSFRWVETYAGFSGASPVLEPLYENLVTEGERVSDDIELYRNVPARLVGLWNTVPRLPWHTDEYYAQEAAILVPEEFARMHRNTWSTQSAEAFIPSALYDVCSVATLPEKSGQLVAGVDAGVSSDCFAFVAVEKKADIVYVRAVRIWTPSGNVLDFDEIEAELVSLVRAYGVVHVAYDPYQLHGMMQRLLTVRGIWTEEFSQAGPRAVADKQLWDLIVSRRLVHDGNAELRQHVLNANRKPTDDGKLRLVKRSANLKIDGAVALSMAVSRVLELNV